MLSVVSADAVVVSVAVPASVVAVEELLQPASVIPHAIMMESASANFFFITNLLRIVLRKVRFDNLL